jgi:hypothetical protein
MSDRNNGHSGLPLHCPISPTCCSPGTMLFHNDHKLFSFLYLMDFIFFYDFLLSDVSLRHVTPHDNQTVSDSAQGKVLNLPSGNQAVRP